VKPTLAVIVASTRNERIGSTVADWFVARATPDDRFDVDVIDLRETELDERISDHHPRSGVYSPEVTAFAQRIAAADAFVIITPEYNHGYPSSLKHALDSVSGEWNLKPVAIVSYGGISGGLRAAEQLKAVFGELRMHDIREAVVLPMVFGKFDDEGNPTDPTMNDAATNMLTELDWWAQALRTARATTPFPL
jgi:NAD(P)H-dependent FMN reductase